MQVNPYLFYNGNCEAAFKFYEKTLGGKIEMLLRNEEAPEEMPAPPERKKQIMHARISIDGEVLMASDAPPEHFHKPQGFSVSLTVGEPAEAERKLRRFRRAAASTCRSARRSSPRDSACASISSAFPGW
jgi:PhnB protein